MKEKAGENFKFAKNGKQYVKADGKFKKRRLDEEINKINSRFETIKYFFIYQSSTTEILRLTWFPLVASSLMATA